MKMGEGFSAELDGLHMVVQVMEDGWYYRIIPTKGGTALLDWTRGPAPSTSNYQEPEDVKFEAITSAIGLLSRKDDPHELLRRLQWRQFGAS